jgi:hypothetical protein
MDNFFIIWIISSIVNCVIWIPILCSKQTGGGLILFALLLIEISALILAIKQPSPIIYWVAGGFFLNLLVSFVIAVKKGFYSKEEY